MLARINWRSGWGMVSAATLPLSGLLLLAGCSGGSSTRPATTTARSAVTTPEAIATLTEELKLGNEALTRAEPGAPIPGLTPDELGRFREGLEEFSGVETPADGVGPVFNGISCAECHAQGGIGGSAFDQMTSVVTRIGGWEGDSYSDLTAYGGPVLQRRSVREFDPASPVAPEVIPATAQYVSRRTTTPLFGAGLIEAIPEALIARLADPDDRDGDGISGRINHVVNVETGVKEYGRFGWKAQGSRLHIFAAEAYVNEMGITSPLFPYDLLPQGQPIPIGADLVPEPEDDGEDVLLFADFIRFLAPPPTPRVDTTSRGAQAFARIGCVSCHIPTLATGENPIAALSRKLVPLYSDLLLHDMGPGLADGICQGEATGNEFRTAPLWGLHLRPFLLHDGRATSIEQAILAHGGEAANSRAAFFALTDKDRGEVLSFLGSL